MRALVCMLALLFAVGFVADPTLAEDYTFDPPSGDTGGWNVVNNWKDSNGERTGYPDSPEDNATIPSGKTVTVGDDPRENSTVGAIVLENGGTIELYEYFSLTINDNSTINGDILFKSCGIDFCASLTIGEPLIVTGNGRIRGGLNHHDLTPGYISGAQGDTLTIASTFTIQGAIEIKAELINNGVVLVNHAYDTLKLTEWPKIGESGAKWKVTDGKLYVQCQVTGGAKWILKGGQSSSLIFIKNDDDTNTSNLSGDVKLTGGTFRIDKTFCTTGDITATASTNEDNDPMIKVKQSTTATLNASSCLP